MIPFEYKTSPIDQIESVELDMMKISDFIASVNQGFIGFDDGHGYLATNSEESNIRIETTSVVDGQIMYGRVGGIKSEDTIKLPDDVVSRFTHIVWYSK